MALPAGMVSHWLARRLDLRLLTAALLLLLIWVWLRWLPLPASLNQFPQASILLAADGQLLGASIASDQQWRFAPVEQLPAKYRQALLRFEDQHFYYHPGINPLAIGRALYSNLRAGRVVSGGSTLSMQLARLLLQAEQQGAGLRRRHLGSKLGEALLALQLEWRLSKDEILLAYASHAPFGGNIVGLRAAAWRYFGRPPERLSWAEAALLAVLPNSPGLIHPGRDRSRLKAKRDRLLQRLHAAGQLGDLDLQLALLEPLPDRPQSLPSLAPHLLATLKARHPGQSLFATSLDAQLQTRAQAIARRHSERLANEGVHNLALVILDHQQGSTLAYIGNQPWRNAAEFAPAVDIAQRPRSTGSLLKPLLYGLMLQAGEITPDSLVADIPSQFGGYSPQNYDRDYRGAVPAHQALAHSLNIPAVRLLRRYGIARFQQDLQAMGMTSLFRPADDYGLTLILGGAEGSLWELTAIYARMAASARSGSGAWQGEPQLLRGQSGKGHGRDVMGQGAAWLSLQALIEVARPGRDNHWRDFAGSQTIAWKTGTSYGLRDAWAIGSNGRYTIGVWVGNADGEAAQFLSGQTSAAPVLFDMFDSLPKVSWFEPPAAALKTISVCINDGFLAGSQCQAKEVQVPRASHFARITPYHRRIHLDAQGQFRVHDGCEAVSRMQSVDWFVLPPTQEFYWRKQHLEYKPLPPWRPDCRASAQVLESDSPIALLYPSESSRVYIPVDLDGQRSRVVLKAIHRDPEARLYWHLDDQYLGETAVFHDQAVSLEPGMHQLLLLDRDGNRLQRRFRVLGATQGD